MSDKKPEPPATTRQLLMNIFYMVVYFAILFGTIWLVLWGQRRV